MPRSDISVWRFSIITEPAYWTAFCFVNISLPNALLLTADRNPVWNWLIGKKTAAPYGMYSVFGTEITFFENGFISRRDLNL